MKWRYILLLMLLTVLLAGCQYAIIEDEENMVYRPPVATATPEPTPEPLQRGSKGERVAAIQEKLRQYGFLTGNADGDFGGNTEAAVRELGEYMPELRATPAPSREPDTAFAMPCAEDEENTDGMVTPKMEEYLLGDAFAAYHEDVRRGERGAQVKRLQNRLYTLGYLDSGIDGQFGSGTQGALRYFQKQNGLTQSGIADEATQNMLYSTAAKKCDRPARKYMLKVSTSKQRVYAYAWQDGSYSKLTRTMVCSTGKDDTPTPTGTYSSNTGKIGRWYYFNKFDCWAQYVYRITGAYYFHSVLYSEKDTSTLRAGSVSNLGTKASHGCVRLSVEDAKWIYENCASGTTVKVV